MAMVDIESFLFYFIHLMLRFSDVIYEMFRNWKVGIKEDFLKRESWNLLHSDVGYILIQMIQR